MKRQTVILATFLIAVLATATIFAEVAAAQQPIAPTTKIPTVMKDNQKPTRTTVAIRSPTVVVIRPPIVIRPPYYPPPYYPPVYHPPYYRPY